MEDGPKANNINPTSNNSKTERPVEDKAKKETPMNPLHFSPSLGILIAALMCLSEIAAADDARPNILVIMTDQQAASAMSAAGNPYLETPAIDSIAARGVRFDRAYVTQPLCLPSRSSMMTGRYPHEIGTTRNGKEFNGDWPMVSKFLADDGYATAYVGKWHVGAPMSSNLAALSHIAPRGKDDEKTDHAIEYLERDHDKPFFLTVSYINPHNVCQLARQLNDGDVPRKSTHQQSPLLLAAYRDLPDGPIPPLPKDINELPPLPENFAIPENEPTAIREVQAMSPRKHYPTADWDERRWREYLWGYYRICEKLDGEVARLLQALEDENFADNTVVIFVSDHGEGIAAHHWNQKQILYESAVHIPFIIAPPKTEAPGTVSSVLVSTGIDYLPTLLDFAGVATPDTMPGHSLKSVAMGESDSLSRDYVIAETMFASGKNEFGVTGRMIRTEQYKYIIYNRGDRREQLFDMNADPGETNNLAAEKKFQDELHRHRQLLTTWAETTNDEFPYIRAQ
jgi:arylsulfatase A-like enzyme